jgi:hypothetical protein
MNSSKGTSATPTPAAAEAYTRLLKKKGLNRLKLEEDDPILKEHQLQHHTRILKKKRNKWKNQNFMAIRELTTEFLKGNTP